MKAAIGSTELGVKYVYELSGKTNAYSEYLFDRKSKWGKMEKGVTTEVLEGGRVTTKMGLSIHTSADSWEKVQLEDYEMGAVPVPVLVL